MPPIENGKEDPEVRRFMPSRHISLGNMSERDVKIVGLMVGRYPHGVWVRGVVSRLGKLQPPTSSGSLSTVTRFDYYIILSLTRKSCFNLNQIM